jgi:membrane peptidoglycan carboxypeptidase
MSTIVTDSGGKLPVPSANCHRVLPTAVADAVNYILQGVLTTGTAGNIGGLSGREAAGKTGTSNVANNDGTPYAAFAGYTPNLAGYISVFNPISPTGDTMGGQNSCYREEGSSFPSCPGEMFGADAPGSTWHMSFDHAELGPVTYFVPVPADSPFNSQGNGQVVVQPTTPKKKGNGGTGGTGGGGGTGGNPNPTTGPTTK